MKKLIIVIMLVAGVSVAQAQLKVGPHLALPTGNASDLYTLVWGADAYYMFANPNSFLNLGVASGYLNFVGDEQDTQVGKIKIDNAGFIPVAAAGRVVLFSTVAAGADVGYGIGVTGDSDGGFYYRLNAGFDIANVVELNAFYYSIDSDWNAVGINLLFEFGR